LICGKYNYQGQAFLRIPRQKHLHGLYSLTGLALMAFSQRMEKRPKREWFHAQALQCIGLALRTKDTRIKRLYTLESERWLHLAELKTDHDFQDIRTPEYQGVERRKTPRHPGRAAGVILLEREALVECAVRDFSPAGVGLSVPDTVFLPAEFDLTFNHAAQHCIAVWRQPERMGLKFKSAY
jgi:hypothetical protein